VKFKEKGNEVGVERGLGGGEEEHDRIGRKNSTLTSLEEERNEILS
jgi:hypothetical protein